MLNDVFSGRSASAPPCATSAGPVQSVGAVEVRSIAAVIPRYSDPESTWRNCSRSATHWAVEDLPDAAGPSIAMTVRGVGHDP
jgi:hypothetical protein